MMSDEQQADTDTETPKRGRPRGSTSKRRVKREPVHRGAHPEDDGQDPLANFEYRPFEQENLLAIDPDIVRGIEREWGYSLLWVCFEAGGKPFPSLVSARKRNGYAEVRAEN